MDELKEEIKSSNLNSIALNRLASSLSSVAENKINEFQENNKNFRVDKVAYWNYKYNLIAKGYEKIRELESFILSLVWIVSWVLNIQLLLLKEQLLL